MIKLTDLKEGDIVKVLHDEVEREGTVVQIGRDDNKALINNGIQEFWYSLDQIIPVPLTEDRLINTLGFDKMETETGVKYMKGAFRILVHDPGNFTNLEIWYREDRRHFNHPLYVHELQNHHLSMTKVSLEKAPAH
ncbi:MAG: hypothetical protein M3352_09460 [Bacteroidota bacterium]|nr:hypothetical protein [Bacteroidota bacterium]